MKKAQTTGAPKLCRREFMCACGCAAAGAALTSKGLVGTVVAAEAANRAGVKICVSRVASLLTVFFSGEPVVDYETAKNADIALFNKFFHHLLAEGIYWPPSQFEAAFVSLAHSDGDITRTIRAVGEAFRHLKE